MALATKLPRKGACWHKHLFLLRMTHKFALKAKYQHIAGTKGFHREWIKPEYLEPLIVIIWLITYEGKYTIFKSCRLRLLAHFVNNWALNFPFYFLKSLEKMLRRLGKIPLIPLVAYITTVLLKF